MKKELFFELLQVALGNRERLSRIPTADEWEEIYEESGRQAVTGVLLHGIVRLPAEQRPSKVFLLQWIGEGQMIEQQNQVMDEHCLMLLRMLEEQGLKGSILKGQGIAKLYDKELRPLRQSGDIDVYVGCGIEKAMAFARMQGQENVEYAYKHLQLEIWDDTEIEMHVRVEVLLNLWKNRRLQKWFNKHQDALFNDNVNHNDNEGANTNSTNQRSTAIGKVNDANRFVTSTVEFNVFYILLHIYRHFLYEGVGFRQIIDYYFVLKQLRGESLELSDSSELKDSIAAVSEFGMEKFARGLMWVVKEALGMPAEWMLWKPDKKEGEYILKQVMAGGNFGHYKKRKNKIGGKFGTFLRICSHNIHLFSHYPSDTIWAPLYFVWLKLWKMTRRV